MNNPYTDGHIKKLLGDIILVEQLEQDKISDGGIFIPQTADQLKIGIRARVLQVGTKFRYAEEFNLNMPFNERDSLKPLIVIVSKYLGTAIDKHNDRIRIYDGEDILGIVEGIANGTY